jgi:predicted PurR-regulated permease PerM
MSSQAPAEMSRHEYAHRVLVTVGIILAAAAMVAIVVVAPDVLLILFGGVLLAVVLDGVAGLLADRSRLSRRASLVLVTSLLFIALGLAAWLLIVQIADQLDQLGGNLTRSLAQVEAQLKQQAWGRQLLALLSHAQSDSGQDPNVVSRAARGLSTTLGGIANTFIVLLIGVYLAARPDWYRRGVLRAIRPDHRPRAQRVLSAMGHTLRWWLIGRVAGMLVVGIVTTVGLYLLDVPLALSLGLIAALFDFVPFVGPLVAAAPAMMVAVGDGPTQALYVGMLYFAVQVLEGYVLTPLIEQRSVELPPALTIAAQLLLGVLVGPLGVVFATPLAAVAVVLIEHLYVEEVVEHATPEDQPAKVQRSGRKVSRATHRTSG